MKYSAPSGPRTMSFGLLNRLPSYLSASTLYFPSASTLNDRAQDAGGGDEPAFGIERAAVGIADLEHRFDAAVRINARQPVLLFVADVQEAARIPHRPFREAEAAGHLLQLGVLAISSQNFGDSAFNSNCRGGADSGADVGYSSTIATQRADLSASLCVLRYCKPNARIVDPAATPIYCLPSTV